MNFTIESGGMEELEFGCNERSQNIFKTLKGEIQLTLYLKKIIDKYLKFCNTNILRGEWTINRICIWIMEALINLWMQHK